MLNASPADPPGILPVPASVAWTLVAFLWVCYFLNYCDRQVVYSIFPLLEKDLVFSRAQLGFTGSVFIWSTGIASPFTGKLSERFSRKWLAVASLILWSCVTIATGLASSPVEMLGARVLLGITEAFFIPIAV